MINWNLTFLLAVSAFVSSTSGVGTGNALTAASLESAATVIPSGSYTFTNVATGEKLLYEPAGNHIFPTRTNAGTPINIAAHGKGAPWLRFEFGNKNKCLSSAWGGQFDNSAVAYVCAVGKSGQRSTLGSAAQWWLAVPVSKTFSHVKRGAEMQHKGSKRSMLGNNGVAISESASANLTATSADAVMLAATSKSVGTFYIIPSSHLVDQQTRALTAKMIVSRGIKSTALLPWTKGNPQQEWVLTRS